MVLCTSLESIRRLTVVVTVVTVTEVTVFLEGVKCLSGDLRIVSSIYIDYKYIIIYIYNLFLKTGEGKGIRKTVTSVTVTASTEKHRETLGYS